MNAYVQRVIDRVKEKYPHEPEFIQTVEEVLSSVSPIVDKHPEYEDADLLTRMTEPDRIITFRVVWVDDKGKTQINTGYR
ncbi:MAG: NADP-specific glutamate dehydrogenase, partial [Oscillospiraceae bacterium]|nr:NADP-specific glutamate dehydrogenase [Oscillospiraceae bacterium]